MEYTIKINDLYIGVQGGYHTACEQSVQNAKKFLFSETAKIVRWYGGEKKITIEQV
ncbi:MAG: hypothetical protein JKX85_00040 [Phycisphaeraceae bacterium]|nr:hypothetical protein [Phycisphaeraceae bacterium]